MHLFRPACFIVFFSVSKKVSMILPQHKILYLASSNTKPNVHITL